jgi:hypothetical protein
MATDEMVIGDAPVEVNVMVWVDGVFRLTLPKVRLVALMLSVAVPELNCSEKVLETEPAIADSVTLWVVLTDATVAVKLALAEPAATATADGTVTAALLLERPTLKPPLAAAAFSVTVQESVPALVKDELVHESAVSTGTPVPLNEMAVEVPPDELLIRVNCPLATPATVGSNCTVNEAD